MKTVIIVMESGTASVLVCDVNMKIGAVKTGTSRSIKGGYGDI